MLSKRQLLNTPMFFCFVPAQRKDNKYLSEGKCMIDKRKSYRVI